MEDKLDNIELRSEEVQEILTRIPHWMVRQGSLLFFVLILMVFLLSWLVKYPDIIFAEGIITTPIPAQKEYARANGKIEQILVSNNQLVTPNTPLAVLENPANFKDVFYLKSILDSIKPNPNSFYFPMDSLPVLFLGDLEADFAVFQNNYILYQLNKQYNPFDNEMTANKISQTELLARLSLLENQKQTNKSELVFKEKELERHKKLYEKGVISAQEYEAKQLEYLQAERNYKNMSVSLSQLRESLSNTKRDLQGNTISKNSEEVKLLKAVLQSFNQLKKAIKNWELQYAFISNIEGRVSFLSAWGENQAVNTGDLLFTIIPGKNGSYIARLKAPSQNAGKIKVGQKVNVSIENYPDEEFGVLPGKVKGNSLLPDDKGLYTVEVELPKKLITTYNKEIGFTQEMRVGADIVTEDLRLLHRFLYQFRSVLNRN